MLTEHLYLPSITPFHTTRLRVHSELRTVAALGADKMQVLNIFLQKSQVKEGKEAESF